LALRREAEEARSYISEFEDSKDKIMMGAEQRTMVMTEQEKMLTVGRDIEQATKVARAMVTPLGLLRRTRHGDVGR
jgi:ATP-dependent Zn protease